MLTISLLILSCLLWWFKNDPFRKLQEAFCEKRGLSVASTKFLFDGLQLLPTQTPEDQDMEDEDIIDVKAG